MNNTPSGNRKHIVILGDMNVGKSSIMNFLTGQDISIISTKSGTTTDIVRKPIEILGLGPVVLIDTAGVNDKEDELGAKRVNKSLDSLKGADTVLYVLDAKNISLDSFKDVNEHIKKYKNNLILVVNKIDEVDKIALENLKKQYKKAVFISAKEKVGFDDLIEKISKSFNEQDRGLLEGVVKAKDNIVLVVPIDSEAPKGRLILPQVQVIRECLDIGAFVHVTRDTELEDLLEQLGKVDLVITDSQAFKKVDEIVPKNIKLTSFSILFARQKGELKTFVEGIKVIKDLKPKDKILIAESCTHNTSHEDIAKVKIPKLLQKRVGGELEFVFKNGMDFADNVKDYKLIIHCGACMINRKTVINRVNECEKREVPITNFGIILAYLVGIIDRAIEPFEL
ncbi:MAG: [FeFe] hydrogenase H-cluster maturation GTPase HydF [Sarcina sp.]